MSLSTLIDDLDAAFGEDDTLVPIDAVFQVRDPVTTKDWDGVKFKANILTAFSLYDATQKNPLNLKGKLVLWKYKLEHEYGWEHKSVVVRIKSSEHVDGRVLLHLQHPPFDKHTLLSYVFQRGVDQYRYHPVEEGTANPALKLFLVNKDLARVARQQRALRDVFKAWALHPDNVLVKDLGAAAEATFEQNKRSRVEEEKGLE
jgi:hypothetical protein